jgi:hypothetical protein
MEGAMGISRTEAASALTDIEQTTGRSYELRGYRIAGPIFIAWGVIWVIGYLAMGLYPQSGSLVWIPLDLVGFVLSALLARRGKAAHPAAADRGTGWRSFALAMAVTAFLGVTFTLFKATSPEVYLVYPGLICGLIYSAIGIWRMTRYVWIGAGMFAASLVGFYVLQPWLAFWMAGVGGVGLILGGLWMRRA